MKTCMVLCFTLIAMLGCARLRVEAPKEAIKLDVSMRLDIYQHIEKDIDSIENMVSGSTETPPVKGNQSFLGSLIGNAHADDGLGAETQAAVARRKERHDRLMVLEAQGIIGEGVSGWAEAKEQSPSALALVDEENNDRKVIYMALAQKNGSSVEEVGMLYAKRLQADAPSGTPVEGGSGWTVK